MPIEDKLFEEFPLTPQRNNSVYGPKRKNYVLKGPLRVIRLCLLGIFLPCFLAILILYMRYRVYIETLYPLAVSDMRVLDNRVSTTWCQGQNIKVNNATFNAFLLPDSPKMTTETKPLTMVRHLMLEDDTKEYWGFYLLKGSVVTLSTCVRWPGASLIVIRGHKHLHECAYIGDNSSEELDEVIEAIKDGTFVYNASDAPSNIPNMMRRHREEVEFHHPSHKNSSKNHTLNSDGLDTPDYTDDPKHMKQLLALLSNTKDNKKDKPIQKKATEKPKAHMHVHRNSTIGKGEQNNFNFTHGEVPVASTVQVNNSDSLLREVLRKLKDLGDDGDVVLQKINEHYRLNKVEPQINMGRKYSKPTVAFEDPVDEQSSERKKREIYLSGISSDFNKHDEENDLGIEEGLDPDGIADHHGAFNDTTLNDRSNSEFWSSFSSSEEALLNCSGLILNLPLTPHTHCKRDFDETQIQDAYSANTVSYKVPTNGYYFFVFNSENEIQTNYLRVRFFIQKTLYNVSNPVESCKNQTDSCQVNLRFFSNEKLVMELPVDEDDDKNWNEEYVVVSECQPRTALYVICVIAIPVFVILFAFQ